MPSKASAPSGRNGRTHLRAPRDAANLPIEIAQFGDDYRITSVIMSGELRPRNFMMPGKLTPARSMNVA